MSQNVIVTLRNAAKGNKEKDEGDGVYTGSRHNVVLKSDEMQQALEVTLHQDEKGKTVGVEIGGYVLPFSIVKSGPNKLSEILRAYKSGRQAIIRTFSLYVPRG